MLKLIHTKILLAILAALAVIGGLLVHQNRLAHQQAADAARARTILEQQQKQAEQERKEAEEFSRKVEAEKRKSHTFNAGGWKTVPNQ